MLKLEELEQIIREGAEQRSIEFKGVGNFTDPGFRASIIKAALGMSNNRDGGIVIVGMVPDDARPGFWTPAGLTEAQAGSFEPDVVSEQTNRHASPLVELTSTRQLLGSGKTMVVLQVSQFSDYPTLCVKDVVGENNKPVVRKGALLVRSRRKAETTEIQSPDDLRHLVDLATEIAIARNARLRSIEASALAPDSKTRFREQLGDF